jgi:hypothetical protein
VAEREREGGVQREREGEGGKEGETIQPVTVETAARREPKVSISRHGPEGSPKTINMSPVCLD